MVNKQGLVMKQSSGPVNGPDILNGASLKLYIPLNAQQIWYALVASPKDAVPKSKMSLPDPDAATSKLCPTYGAGTGAPEPQTWSSTTMRAAFVFVRPKPVTWTVQDTVMGQLSLFIVNGPWSRKTPLSKEKSSFEEGLCAQQSLYRAPEVPCVM
jgi:hypothetical protein